MKAKEPLAVVNGSSIIPHLRTYIVDKVEDETNLAVLQQLYAIVSRDDKEAYADKFAKTKAQTEQYCVPALADELEAEGFMFGKPYPFDDVPFDIEQAIADDAKDEPAPKEWLDKMFPELHVRG